MVTSVTSFGRSGLADWLVQRLTALILLSYFLFIVGYLVFNADVTYTDWKALFALTSVRVFSLAALLSICMHAWIGLWAVSTDYLTERQLGSKGTILRLVFQVSYSAVIFTYLVWGVQVLWGL